MSLEAVGDYQLPVEFEADVNEPLSPPMSPIYTNYEEERKPENQELLEELGKKHPAGMWYLAYEDPSDPAGFIRVLGDLTLKGAFIRMSDRLQRSEWMEEGNVNFWVLAYPTDGSTFKLPGLILDIPPAGTDLNPQDQGWRRVCEAVRRFLSREGAAILDQAFDGHKISGLEYCELFGDLMNKVEFPEEQDELLEMAEFIQANNEGVAQIMLRLMQIRQKDLREVCGGRLLRDFTFILPINQSSRLQMYGFPDEDLKKMRALYIY